MNCIFEKQNKHFWQIPSQTNQKRRPKLTKLELREEVLLPIPMKRRDFIRDYFENLYSPKPEMS